MSTTAGDRRHLVSEAPPYAWPSDARALDAEQRRLAALHPPLWRMPTTRFTVAGCFVAFARGQQGPGHPGDLMQVGAALVSYPGLSTVGCAVVPFRAGASYDPGRLALREGPGLAAAVRALGPRPDVLLVDATGRDHPRGAGLALHLGAALDVPSVGVTHRPLRASGPQPGPRAGDSSPLRLPAEGGPQAPVVGAWLRTTDGARPVAVSAGWRVDVDTAVRLVAAVARARTPEPLRRARALARTARARAEGCTAT